MTNQKILYGFISGEVSPEFYGRTDLGKYDFGLRLCRNFMVGWQGGLKNRPGTEFVSETPYALGQVRLFRFRATEDDYRLEFSPGRIRPMRYMDYILEVARPITGVTLAGYLVIPGHTYLPGDLVKIEGDETLGGRYFVIESLSSGDVGIAVPGLPRETVASIAPGAVARRAYTISVPYDADAIPEVRLSQRYNTIIITHRRYPVAHLNYVTDTNWTYSVHLAGSEVPKPSGVTLTPSAAGTAAVGFSISAVIDGEEGQGSSYAFELATVNYTTTAGSIRVNWSPVARAQFYNVYRTLVLPAAADMSQAQAVGYIGQARGPQFIDNNIVPDFTKTPPEFFDPFAAAPILEITVTAGGTGYTNASVVTVTDTAGTGFVGFPVVSPAGVILSIVVVNGGRGYLAPSVSVSGGSGAAFSVELGKATGNYPALSALFQQRVLFAATANEPMRLWATKPGTLANFDLGQTVSAGDGYSYQLDAQDIRPIQHLLSLRHGFLAFTSEQVTLLRAEEGKALSAMNAVAEPQVYKGAGAAEPVTIDLDVIFAERGGTSVNAMFYTEYTNSFTLQDLTVLSNHFFCPGSEVSRFAYQAQPYKILWSVLSCGRLLALTYEREQEVFAWTQHVTQGRIRDALVVREGVGEVLYLIVERYLRGRWVLCHEKMAFRDDTLAENFFGVDAGARTPLNLGSVRLDIEPMDDLVQLGLTPPPAGFGPGSMVYFAQGKYEIIAQLSYGVYSARELRQTINRLHVSGRYAYLSPGEWAWANPRDALTGLWHLEGETVSVNLDGDAYLEFPVVNGAVALPRDAYKASAGLAYESEAWTLPSVFASQATEGLLRDSVSVKVRLLQSRGLEVGVTRSDVTEMKDRSEEDWGQELQLRSDFPEVLLRAPWDELNGIYLLQRYPLPVSVLSLAIAEDVSL